MKQTPPFIERDLSWLSFNYRVLQEAKDKSVPLYERLKFLAIYSSNLDEFFRVRVATLRSFRKLGKATKKEMHLRPRKLLKEIRHTVQEQQTEFGRIFRQEILPELAGQGIHLLNGSSLNEAQTQFGEQFFQEKILPLLSPEFTGGEVPFLENKALYFVVSFETPKERLALLKLPSQELGRFVVLPAHENEHYIAFLDDLVRLGLQLVFPGKKIAGAWSVKLSRDAEMYIDDEYAGDLVEKIKQGLEERHVGLPTRFLYDSAMPGRVLEKLKTHFKLSKNDLIPGARYHNFNDFLAFPNLTARKELHDEPLPPLPYPLLEDAPSLLEAVSKRDYLLHFPYQRFDTLLRLLEEATNDPAVESIKITLYRVASRSAVAEGLLKALGQGKKVTAFIEAKARFDEESNLYWGENLEQAGAFVRYSYPGIKVHTKILLITRREGENLKRYAWLGTGNFNEKTALLYADHALLTTDPDLTGEAAQVFDLLEGKILLPRCKKLLVAPFILRQGFEKMVDKEIENARSGSQAFIIAKLNSLEDTTMMNKLIEASRSGVKVRLIVRGICCLAPGVKGFTENIEIVSIIDRFLEHARVYVFANGGKEKMYLASADWMSRNLDRRVEVAFPIYDELLKSELRQIINFQLNDNTKARLIDLPGNNFYKQKKADEKPVRAQTDTYRWLADLTSNKAAPVSGESPV